MSKETTTMLLTLVFMAIGILYQVAIGVIYQRMIQHPFRDGQQAAQPVQGAVYQLLQAQWRRGEHISVCRQVHQPHPHFGDEY